MEPAQLVIFDGHNDTLLQLHDPHRGNGRTFFERSPHGHLDLPRARAGGFAGGLFAIFVPAPTPIAGTSAVPGSPGLRPVIDHAHAARVCDAMLGTLDRVVQASSGQVRVCRTLQEVLNCLRTGVLAVVVHFEGAEQIAPDLSDLDKWYDRGLRSLGLVWARPNVFGYGLPLNTVGSPDIGPGLTDAGRALVQQCDARGILIDLSHLNERGFWDVAELSRRPLVVTHSGAQGVYPSARNLTDRQLDAVRDSGGIVGLSLNVSDLCSEGSAGPDIPLDVPVRHITYMAERMGVDHVGLGCDLDGCTIPCAIGDASGLPKLVAALAGQGWRPEDVQKFAWGNWIRVLGTAWSH